MRGFPGNIECLRGGKLHLRREFVTANARFESRVTFASRGVNAIQLRKNREPALSLSRVTKLFFAGKRSATGFSVPG
jgi:hypothetical protein